MPKIKNELTKEVKQKSMNVISESSKSLIALDLDDFLYYNDPVIKQWKLCMHELNKLENKIRKITSVDS